MCKTHKWLFIGSLCLLFSMTVLICVLGGFSAYASNGSEGGGSGNITDYREQRFQDMIEMSDRVNRSADRLLTIIGVIATALGVLIAALGIVMGFEFHFRHRQSEATLAETKGLQKESEDVLDRIKEVLDEAKQEKKAIEAVRLEMEKELEKTKKTVDKVARVSAIERPAREVEEEEETEETGVTEKERLKLELLEGMVGENPKDTDAYLSIAGIQERLGDYDEVLKAYNQAIESDPLKWEHYRYKADFLMGLNRKEKALECVKKGIDEIPSNQRLTNLAGRILSGMGKWDESEEYYRKSGEILKQKLDSSHVRESTRLNYYENLLILREYKEAKKQQSEIEEKIRGPKYILLIKFFSACLSFLTDDRSDGFAKISDLLEHVEKSPITDANRSTWNFDDLNPYLKRDLPEEEYRLCEMVEEVLSGKTDPERVKEKIGAPSQP